jgi:hypothetical protein
MPKKRLHSRVLLVTTCWLILLASGDDINFARIVLPPTDAAVGDVMPFDDPNFDFTQPNAPPNPQHRKPEAAPKLSTTGSLRPSILSDCYCPFTDHHIPLRC